MGPSLLSGIVLMVLSFDSLLRFVLVLIRLIGPRGRRNGAVEGMAADRGCIILISAHNESGTIGKTIAGLTGQLGAWPGSCVWVIADRCDDMTAAEAARAGAEVAVRGEGRLGKGAAIDWWMMEHGKVWSQRDAVLILDADSGLEAGSLARIRREFEGGADVVQAFVAPVTGSSSGRLAGWSEVLMQRLDDEARRRMGWSVPLRGAGMAFRGEILAALVPRLHTLAEDLELDVLLASSGRRVRFAPEAVVLDPKPVRPEGASRQRARWLQGQLQVIAGYRREIAGSLLNGGAGAFFLLCLLLLRPKVLFIGLRLAMLPVIPLAAGTGLAMDAAYYLAGALFVDRPGRYLLDLMSAPRYVFMWFRGFTLALLKRSRNVWLKAGR